MTIEFIDSFETGISTGRYFAVLGGGATILSENGQGRGTTHTGCLQCSTGGDRCVKVSVAAETTKTAGFAVKLSALPSADAALVHFAEAGTSHVILGVTSSGKLVLYRGNFATKLATATNATLTVGAYAHIEVKVVVNDTTGSIDVRLDEVAVTWDASVSGIDTANGGTPVIDEIWLGHVGGADIFTRYDDFYIQKADAPGFLGDKRAGYSGPNVAGTYTAGTATGAATLLECVDDAPSTDDTDYIAMDNTGLPKAASFAMEDAASNVSAILAVQPVAYVRKDDAGSNTGRLLLISGATEDDGGGVDVASSSAYTAVQRIHETDPNTGVAWTISGFNAIEVGWRRTA